LRPIRWLGNTQSVSFIILVTYVHISGGSFYTQVMKYEICIKLQLERNIIFSRSRRYLYISTLYSKKSQNILLTYSRNLTCHNNFAIYDIALMWMKKINEKKSQMIECRLLRPHRPPLGATPDAEKWRAEALDVFANVVPILVPFRLFSARKPRHHKKVKKKCMNFNIACNTPEE
jgi:hypothetical protein